MYGGDGGVLEELTVCCGVHPCVIEVSAMHEGVQHLLMDKIRIKH